MKAVFAIVGAGVIGLLGGCATPMVTLVPVVGPGLGTAQSLSPQGSLIVFSRLKGQNDDDDQDGDNPVCIHHTDYNVYNLQGRVVKRVWNAAGHYETDPRVVNLPAGQYIVEAQAADYSMVHVTVAIEGGETTEVHLDGQWAPPSHAGDLSLVTMPNGQSVGWRR